VPTQGEEVEEGIWGRVSLAKVGRLSNKVLHAAYDDLNANAKNAAPPRKAKLTM